MYDIKSEGNILVTGNDLIIGFRGAISSIIFFQTWMGE